MNVDFAAAARAAEREQARAVDRHRPRDAAGPSRRGRARRASRSRAGNPSPTRWTGSRRCPGQAASASSRARGRRGALRSNELGVTPARERPLVERVKQAVHLEVREREHVAQAAGEQRAAVTYRPPAAYQLDAHGGERVEIERRPLRSPDELGRGQPPGPGEIVDLVVPLIPHARRVHPPQHVAPRYVRGTARAPHRQGHRPARPLQLGGQLHAGRRRSHDEHAAVGELGGSR